jgi:hypothetical protein
VPIQPSGVLFVDVTVSDEGLTGDVREGIVVADVDSTHMAAMDVRVGGLPGGRAAEPSSSRPRDMGCCSVDGMRFDVTVGDLSVDAWVDCPEGQ